MRNKPASCPLLDGSACCSRPSSQSTLAPGQMLLYSCPGMAGTQTQRTDLTSSTTGSVLTPPLPTLAGAAVHARPGAPVPRAGAFRLARLEPSETFLMRVRTGTLAIAAKRCVGFQPAESRDRCLRK